MAAAGGPGTLFLTTTKARTESGSVGAVSGNATLCALGLQSRAPMRFAR